MQCLILAGGLASRMGPLTERIPKSLIHLGGFPFIHHQLDWISRHGVTDIVLCIGHLGEQIREYVGSGAKWNLHVKYVDEGPQLRGTGGAIRLAADLGVLEDAFLMTYGDSFLPLDFAKVWECFQKQRCPTLMTVFHNVGRWDTSNVWFEDGRVALYDKHRKRPEHADKLAYIDYGLSAFRRAAVIEKIPANQKIDLADVFYDLSIRGEVAGYEATDRFYEIGSPEGLEDFRRYLGQRPATPAGQPTVPAMELSLKT